jgi:hypothetical protein
MYKTTVDKAIARARGVIPYNQHYDNLYRRCSVVISKERKEIILIRRVKIFIHGVWYPDRVVEMHGKTKYTGSPDMEWIEYNATLMPPARGIIEHNLVFPMPGGDGPLIDLYRGYCHHRAENRFILVDRECDNTNIPEDYGFTITVTYDYLSAFYRHKILVSPAWTLYSTRRYRFGVDMASWNRFDFKLLTVVFTQMVCVNINDAVLAVSTFLDRYDETFEFGMSSIKTLGGERIRMKLESNPAWMARTESYNTAYVGGDFYIFVCLNYRQGVDYTHDFEEGYEIYMSDDHPSGRHTGRLKYHLMDNQDMTIRRFVE